MQMSQLSQRSLYETIGFLGVIVTLIGVWLRSRLVELESMGEEAVKNRKLTPEGERRRARAFRWWSAATIFIGLTVLLLAIVNITNF